MGRKLKRTTKLGNIKTNQIDFMQASEEVQLKLIERQLDELVKEGRLEIRIVDGKKQYKKIEGKW